MLTPHSQFLRIYHQPPRHLGVLPPTQYQTRENECKVGGIKLILEESFLLSDIFFVGWEVK